MLNFDVDFQRLTGHPPFTRVPHIRIKIESVV